MYKTKDGIRIFNINVEPGSMDPDLSCIVLLSNEANEITEGYTDNQKRISEALASGSLIKV